VGDASPSPPAKPVAPRPPLPKAPLVAFIAFPGGQIVLDNAPIGRDETKPLRVRPGKHEVKVKNVFLGDDVRTIEVKAGQNDSVVVVW
jgi:hypothetical protein